MTSSSTSAARSVARGVLGVVVACGGLGLVAIALFGVAAIVRPTKPANTPTVSRASGDDLRRKTIPDRPSAKAKTKETPHVLNVERLTDTTVVADFVLVAGETYAQAGARLTEVGKELCLLPGAEAAILNVFGPDGSRLGDVTLPLNSFLAFHEGDATRRAMAASIWRNNGPLLLEMAIGRQ